MDFWDGNGTGRLTPRFYLIFVFSAQTAGCGPSVIVSDFWGGAVPLRCAQRLTFVVLSFFVCLGFERVVLA